MWASLCHVASIRLAQSYQGGQMLAVHGRKTVCALKFSCVQNEGWGGKCWGRRIARPLLAFRALFGKEKPGQCPPKKLGLHRACCLFWHQHAGVILCQKSSFHHPAKFAQFYKCQQKKDKRACANLRTTVSLLDKILVKDIGSGTDTAASRYSHRRESVQPPPLIV